MNDDTDEFAQLTPTPRKLGDLPLPAKIFVYTAVSVALLVTLIFAFIVLGLLVRSAVWVWSW